MIDNDREQCVTVRLTRACPEDRDQTAFLRGQLSGLVGQWMEAYEVDRKETLYHLRCLVAEIELGLDANRGGRLRRLEEGLGLEDREV